MIHYGLFGRHRNKPRKSRKTNPSPTLVVDIPHRIRANCCVVPDARKVEGNRLPPRAQVAHHSGNYQPPSFTPCRAQINRDIRDVLDMLRVIIPPNGFPSGIMGQWFSTLARRRMWEIMGGAV